METLDTTRLEAALKELNEALAELQDRHGHHIEIKPHGNFNLSEGIAYVTVDIVSGQMSLGRCP